jgi:hypothetical protein
MNLVVFGIDILLLSLNFIMRAQRAEGQQLLRNSWMRWNKLLINWAYERSHTKPGVMESKNYERGEDGRNPTHSLTNILGPQ